jgi:hypothetical protein
VLADGDVEVKSAFGGERARYFRVADWKPTPADVAAITGHYNNDEIGMVFGIKVSGDSLMLENRKFAPARLTPLMKDTFSATSNYLPLVIRAVRDKTGRVTAITVGSGRVRRMGFKRIASGAI